MNNGQVGGLISLTWLKATVLAEFHDINVGYDTGQISGVINNGDTFDAVNLHHARRIRDRASGESVKTLVRIASFPASGSAGVGIFAAVRRRFGRRKNLALVHRVVADDDIGQADGNHGRASSW